MFTSGHRWMNFIIPCAVLAVARENSKAVRSGGVSSCTQAFDRCMVDAGLKQAVDPTCAKEFNKCMTTDALARKLNRLPIMPMEVAELPPPLEDEVTAGRLPFAPMAAFEGQLPPAAGRLPFAPLAFEGPMPTGMVLGGIRNPISDPLHDLLAFGGALASAASLERPAADARGAALRVKLQQNSAPAPLRVENVPGLSGALRIAGTLPKKLSEKTLRVSLRDGHDLVVQYLLGQNSGQTSDNAVAVNEQFSLDFEPEQLPQVKYQPASGAFEMVVAPPKDGKEGQQVHIDFEDSTPPVPKKTAIVKAAQSAQSSDTVSLRRLRRPATSHHFQVPKEEFDAKVKLNMHKKEDFAKEWPYTHTSIPVVGKNELADEERVAASSAPSSSVPLRASSITPRTVSGPPVVADSKPLAALPISKNFDALAKKTKELEADVAKASKDYNNKFHFENKDREARAKLIVDKAKEFVTEAHLSDAKHSLEDAFAPIDDGTGLVMIEIEHKVRK